MFHDPVLVSVDVDSLDLYLGLYGENVSESERQELVATTYRLGVLRFAELFEELGLSGVFFLVGRDLDNEEARNVVGQLVDRGHRLGNHSQTHPYELIRLPDSQAFQEIAQCHEVIERVAGVAPAIFRAPGYNMTAREYRFLSQLGYVADSSPLPSPPYLALKYGVLAFLALRGKKSRSIWGDPRGFLGPRNRYEREGLSVLPCATTRGLRLPIIGTSLSTVPEPVLRHLTREALTLSPLVLEFHAVDLMGIDDDGLPARLALQKDLRIPVSEKRRRFLGFLKRVIGEARA